MALVRDQPSTQEAGWRSCAIAAGDSNHQTGERQRQFATKGTKTPRGGKGKLFDLYNSCEIAM